MGIMTNIERSMVTLNGKAQLGLLYVHSARLSVFHLHPSSLEREKCFPLTFLDSHVEGALEHFLIRHGGGALGIYLTTSLELFIFLPATIWINTQAPTKLGPSKDQSRADNDRFHRHITAWAVEDIPPSFRRFSASEHISSGLFVSARTFNS
jgi:hypothetical protein